MPKVYAAPVFAAAYLPSHEGRYLMHAVADDTVREGRLKREAGQAFCGVKNVSDDTYSWEAADQVTCEKCKSILKRFK